MQNGQRDDCHPREVGALLEAFYVWHVAPVARPRLGETKDVRVSGNMAP